MVNSEKLKKLAKIIVNHSVEVKKGEKVLIRGFGFDCLPLVKEIYREALLAKACEVNVRFSHQELNRVFYETASDEQITFVSDLDKKIADSYDCLISIVADEDPYAMKGIDFKKMEASSKAYKEISEINLSKKWLLYYYPTLSSSILAKKPLNDWENFSVESCLVDWKKVEEIEKKFIEVMKKVDKVRIIGEETDLSLSVKGQNWRPCCGKRNLPDGEIFTAPIRDSVEGVIKYNIPSRYMSFDFEYVKLWLEKGQVVNFESDNQQGLEQILSTDEGAKYFGEFAFGLNDNIKSATKKIIFDEKMGKSLHMALGKCYKECPNGNESSIHWDLIFKFSEAKAEIFFDDEKVFEKGEWIMPELNFLNSTEDLFEQTN